MHPRTGDGRAPSGAAGTAPGDWARVSAVGPYFAVSCGPRPDTAGFRPLTELYEDPGALGGYVADTARRMGTADRRVAASTLHLGLAARLWSVALGATVLTGRVPGPGPGRLWWRAPRSGPVDLWLPDPAGPATATATEAEAAVALHTAVVAAHLEPLARAVRRDCGVSPHTLLGNTASALIGAVRVLRAHAPGAPLRPLPLAAALLGRAPLADAGTFTAAPFAFRRRSCCLYYRVEGGGYCGDCVLVR
ncbi:(2Fe-2S)-binding protein [Streptomyces sp. NPDC015131]|uniref:(2Fe-2S)-binding protein n=1 Tax=Streptomyces sp. NPDC015131 TaxID=3364941 RepID=UPI0036FC838E